MDKSIGVYAQHFCNQYAAVSSSGSGAYKSYHVEIPDKNTDTFTRSAGSYTSRQNISVNQRKTSAYDAYKQLEPFRELMKSGKVQQLKVYHLESETPEGIAKNHFECLNDLRKYEEESLSGRLEKAGVPKDVTFEFDYNMDTYRAEVTKVSDEKYLDDVRSVIEGKSLPGMLWTAHASRIMNGYMSSVYYPAIAKNLQSCYGQDIADLYIDENGTLCGANKNLRKAIEASKRGEVFQPDPHREFPSKNIEELIKRLISDENITPNISHMGFDGEKIFTNDGEFKFGKDFDPSLFSEKRYVMRGSISVFYSYDSWLKNEELYN